MTVISIAAIAMLEGISASAEAYADRQHQTHCLTEAVYYEARDEPIRGQVAVAWVVLNRVTDNGTTACAEIRKPFQFSYRNTNIQNKDKNRQAIAWDAISVVVEGVLAGRVADPTKGARCFYNPSLASPGWSASWMPKQRIGSHLFVHCQAKQPGKRGEK